MIKVGSGDRARGAAKWRAPNGVRVHLHNPLTSLVPLE